MRRWLKNKLQFYKVNNLSFYFRDAYIDDSCAVSSNIIGKYLGSCTLLDRECKNCVMKKWNTNRDVRCYINIVYIHIPSRFIFLVDEKQDS